MRFCDFAILAMFTNMCLAAPIEATVRAEPLNTTGIHGYEAYAISNHRAIVSNNTDTIKNIIVKYVICVDGKGCDDSKWYRVKVNPHGVWQDTYQTKMTVTFKYIGNYQVTGKTIITGATETETTGYGNLRID